MIIYSNIIQDNNLTGSALLHDVLKKHWVNATKLYTQYGYDTISARNVTVCATNNNAQFNEDIVTNLLVDYDVIYFNRMDRGSSPYTTLRANVKSFDNFVCEFSVFFKLMSIWKEVDTSLTDDDWTVQFRIGRMLEYQNMIAREVDFLKVDA